MHSTWTLLAVVALCWCAAGQDPPLTLSLTPAGPETVNANLGDKIDVWRCEVNRGLTFIVEGLIDWIHVDAAGNEVLVARNKNLQESGDHYGINFEFDFNTYIHSTIVIKSVRNEDLGKWICRATLKGDVQEASRHLDMFHDMTDVELTVGGVGPYKLEMTEGVQFEEGRRGFKCDVKGGNPEATIHMRLGNKDLQLDEINSIKMGDGMPTNFHTVAMGTVELTGDDTDNTLTCIGKVGDFPERSVAVKLDILTFSPSIHCTNKTTSKGDKFVQASCVVLYQKPVKNVSLEVGDSNVIVAGSDHKHGDTKFFTRSLNATAMEVVIDVYEMLDHHFSHVYYVNVFGHDNKVYREPVIFINAGLNKESGASSLGSSTLSLLSASLLMLVLVRCLQW